MRLSELARGREPDIQVLLPGYEWRVGATFVEGPADLVIEIVSPESVERDRGEKFTEYERGGVKEYWLFDPQRREHLFYVLGEDGLYSPRYPDADGIYRSPVFPKLALPVALLWQQPLPGIRQIIALVDTMLEVGS
jgi:Uma2 family endonuclease